MKTNILTTIISATWLAGITVPMAPAAEPAPAGSIENAAADGRFMAEVVQSNRLVMKASELAVERTKRDDLKAFATEIRDEHAEMDKHLEALGDKLNVKLPKAMADAQQTTFDVLQKTTDAEFDRTYMDTMVSQHRKLVTLFEETSKATKHPDVKAFVDLKLPRLQAHQEKARELAKLVSSLAAK
jgi:putative membrane protein